MCSGARKRYHAGEASRRAKKPVITIRQRIPASSTTNNPDITTMMAVPVSFWIIISTAGIRIIRADQNKCLKRGGSGRLPRYQAIISGTTIFIISEGWKLGIPGKSIQLRAPPASTPMISTRANRASPAPYIESAQLLKTCTLNWDTINIANIPTTITRACRRTTVSLPSLAL